MEAYASALSESNQLSDDLPRLLLFVDNRTSATDQVSSVRQSLRDLEGGAISLETVDVVDHPYLAEHFKLVATPALVRVTAGHHQVLAGSDLSKQLEYWWPLWACEEGSLKAHQKIPSLVQGELTESGLSSSDTATQSAEIIRLRDEIFKLEQEKSSLTSQLAFKDRIIAMMAHDLRNPLTAASIALETLELAYEPGSKKAERFTPELISHLLRSTKAQIRTINGMITEILRAARGPDANLNIVPVRFELKHLCDRVTADLRAKLDSKKQTLDVDIPQDLPAVYADPDQIQRVLTNLIDNAIKYTPTNGQISISALHRTTEKIQVSIRDTGLGIPSKNQKVIFEENFRLKRDQTEDGYGLGLALCQRIIRAHYGRIWVDSKQDEGSCFHFTLPVDKG